MKQIHEAVQALESNMGFWRPFRILLKKLKKRQKKLPGNFPRIVSMFALHQYTTLAKHETSFGSTRFLGLYQFYLFLKSQKAKTVDTSNEVKGD